MKEREKNIRMGKPVKNPLKRRILRELRDEWRKYLVISLFLVLMVGFVSGMYVANGSMTQALSDGVTRYNQEDGHFELSKEADEETIETIESGKVADFKASPVTLYENFYRDQDEDDDADGSRDATIRIYQNRTDIDEACVMSGRLPENENEIAIDRMHADNAEIKVGDTISAGGEEYQVTGLISLVDYICLYEKNTDSMFDALNFDVGVVTADGFERLSANIHYDYSWKYEDTPEDEREENTRSKDFTKVLAAQCALSGNELKDYVPAYTNQAIQFAPEDIGSDKVMGGVLLYILIAVIAFIFAITISNTIAKEATVIGTLRASGYTKKELLRHYMAMPVIVTLLSALVGNVLGYTVFKNVVVSMYYNSYSLPTFVTVWSSEAFLKTTLIPVALMIVINYVVIRSKLSLSPLKFLRHDLKKMRRRKAMRLPDWGFLRRFRMRIFFQNLAGYLVLFVGITFVMLMLSMAVGFPDSLAAYQDSATDNMIAKDTLVLTRTTDADGNTITTQNSDAERFSMTALLYKNGYTDEEISVYGLEDDSAYVSLSSLSEGEVCVTSSWCEKYGIKIGDTIKLQKKYEDTSYTFTVKETVEAEGSLAVYMPNAAFNEIFDRDEDAFNGYLSDSEIQDIPEKYIANEITEEDVTKISRQLEHSMGNYMRYFEVLCVLLSAVLIYLLTKIIIERNEDSISMVKILGYENREISSLYQFTTTIVVLVSEVISILIDFYIMKAFFAYYMKQMEGWFTFVITPIGFLKMFGFVFFAYLFVMVLDFKRIRKIPMERALKNVS